MSRKCRVHHYVWTASGRHVSIGCAHCRDRVKAWNEQDMTEGWIAHAVSTSTQNHLKDCRR